MVTEMERYKQRERIKENIDYGSLLREHPYDNVESLLELIVDAMSSTAMTIRIGKEVLPAETVKRRFLGKRQIKYRIADRGEVRENKMEIGVVKSIEES